MVWQGPNGALNLRSQLMEELSQVSSLVSLNLCGNAICRKPRTSRTGGNDAEIAHALFAGLAKLPSLETLNLAHTRVLPGLLSSYPAPSALSGMSSLTLLDISGALDPEQVEADESQKLGKVLTRLYSLKELPESRIFCTVERRSATLNYRPFQDEGSLGTWQCAMLNAQDEF